MSPGSDTQADGHDLYCGLLGWPNNNYNIN